MKRTLTLAISIGIMMPATTCLADTPAQQADYYGKSFILSKNSFRPYGSLYYSFGTGTSLGYGTQTTQDADQLSQGFAGPLVQIGFGYDRVFLEHFFGAAELSTQYVYAPHRERHTANAATWDLVVKAPVRYGATLLAGYRLDNNDIFYLSPRFKVIHANKNTSEDVTARIGTTKNFNMNSLGYGVGYKMNLDQTSSLRLDFYRMQSSKSKQDATSYERKSNEFNLLWNHYLKPINPIKTLSSTTTGLYTGGGAALSGVYGNHVEVQASNGVKQHNLDLGSTGIAANATIGFDTLLDPKTYLAIEASYLYEHLKIDSHDKNQPDALLKAGSAYQLNLAGGIPLANQTIVMGIIGGTMAKFEKTQPMVAAADPRDDLGPKFNQHLWGLNLGLGYLATLNTHWKIKGEYNHQFHQSFRKTSLTGTGEDDTHYDWLIQTNQLMVSAHYYF